jgi:hypothetical protein
MKEMFEASVDGLPYDSEKWGNYFRPYGVDAPSGSAASSNTSSAPSVAPASKEDDAPFEADEPVVVTAPAVSKDKAQDILAKIKARQTQA